MEFCKGDLVVCTSGREKDRLMCVAEFDGKYVYVCDGKERKLDNPNTSVEDAVKLHTRGMELISKCEAFLAKAELTITEVHGEQTE